MDRKLKEMFRTLFGEDSDTETDERDLQLHTTDKSEERIQSEVPLEDNQRDKEEKVNIPRVARKGGREALINELNQADELFSNELKLQQHPKIVISLQQPIAPADKMAMLKASNSFGINETPYDPKTFIEQDMVPRKSTILWREVENTNGEKTRESNARIIKWSNGSTQLQIGTEMFNIMQQGVQSVKESLLLNAEKGNLVSQGLLTKKLRVTPCSLDSTSYDLLAARMKSQSKKVPKVKFWDDIDEELAKLIEFRKNEEDVSEKSEKRNIASGATSSKGKKH